MMIYVFINDSASLNTILNKYSDMIINNYFLDCFEVFSPTLEYFQILDQNSQKNQIFLINNYNGLQLLNTIKVNNNQLFVSQDEIKEKKFEAKFLLIYKNNNHYYIVFQNPQDKAWYISDDINNYNTTNKKMVNQCDSTGLRKIDNIKDFIDNNQLNQLNQQNQNKNIITYIAASLCE